MNDAIPKTEVSEINISYLINNSPNFQQLKNELQCAVRTSYTGITNLIVNYEDPIIVDEFLKECFPLDTLYNRTIGIDAVELQQGHSGSGICLRYLDQLIYGTLEEDADSNFKIDDRTGKRSRLSNGFVNRKEVISGNFKDRTLIIRNLDSTLDFCIEGGVIDQKALYIFDNFRNPIIKGKCRILLVTNKRLILPFKTRIAEFNPIDKFEAEFLIDSIINLYKTNKYDIMFTRNQKEQLIRKVIGLTYTNAGDAIIHSVSQSEYPKDSKIISSNIVLKKIREKINKNYMEDGFGLTQLTAKPWEDYICPESSNFTFDVYKILRDFKEIERLRKISESKIMNKEDETESENLMEAIRNRIPHVIVIYGKGGLGKSAFSIHLAGLLNFDVWDFNINAVHSKWVGEGSRQMRTSLRRITSSSHLIIRVDEYDRAIGATGESGAGMHEAHKQVECEFINWLQNSQEENLFVKNNIIVILTTNHKENITGPLLRSGRSDLVIDIDSFDAKSIKETFFTSARRMKNRGIKIIGFNNEVDLQNKINELDLDLLSAIVTAKGFTVRDIETLIMEMSAHNYYYKNTSGNEGLEWNTDNFYKVLENSEGSIKENGTGELILGDRTVLQKKNKVEDKIEQLELFPNDNVIRDRNRLNGVEGFIQK